jgi:N-acetylneuraminate synthase
MPCSSSGKVAATGKPVIVSTGMATLAEVDETVRTLRAGGCNDIVLLKCTSTYPATPENSNLNTIPHLRDLFGCEVGLLDHQPTAPASQPCRRRRRQCLLRGTGRHGRPGHRNRVRLAGPGRHPLRPIEAEKPSMRFRRSIYIAQNIKAGEVLTRENLLTSAGAFALMQAPVSDDPLVRAAYVHFDG